MADRVGAETGLRHGTKTGTVCSSNRTGASSLPRGGNTRGPSHTPQDVYPAASVEVYFKKRRS
jgi:hypothetical protein